MAISLVFKNVVSSQGYLRGWGFICPACNQDSLTTPVNRSKYDGQVICEHCGKIQNLKENENDSKT